MEMIGFDQADIRRSPSTRRAWIEIDNDHRAVTIEVVALHPEGVDRNAKMSYDVLQCPMSPSTRRAWREIEKPRPRLKEE